MQQACRVQYIRAGRRRQEASVYSAARRPCRANDAANFWRISLLPMMGNARDPVTRSIIKLLIANFERYEAFVQKLV
jgi:hypothetical protein